MTHRVTRRGFLSVFSAIVASPALAGAPISSLRPVLRGEGFAKKAIATPDSILGSAKLGGRVTFAVADARSGRVLEAQNGAQGTPPASVTKSITALYAINTLGAGHRFVTRVIATGGISNGEVQGDLVLVGGADPTLDSNHLADLAAQLKARGIRAVRGKFLVYDKALPRVDRIDAAQPDHVGYNPGISGLALNYNRVHFEWRRGSNGYAVTMDARTEKYRPDVTVAQMTVVNRNAPVYTYKSSSKRDEWTVSRQALGNRGARWLPVRVPGLYAGDVFRTMARAQGIVLPAAQLANRAPQGSQVALHQSDPLQEILRDMLKFSNNLIAEMVGLAATAKRKGVPASLKASATEMSRWADATLGMRRSKFVDHSGLGDASSLTAEDMCQAMVMARAQGFRGLLKDFGLRDAKGRPQKNHPIKVHAKTGTLNFVSTLAGYITAPDGREMVFAILAADEATRSRISKANREAPQGARSWNRRAKIMQQKLIERWGALYSN